MNLPQFAVRHPVTVAMIMVGIGILGLISLDRLGTDLLPAIYNPRIVVELQAGERSPQEMEERFARRLEGDLRSISRVVDVRTVCRLGQVVATATFAWGADMDFALLDIQKKVASYEADPEVDRVTVARFDPQAEPVMIYALQGGDERDMDEMRRIAERVIKLDLERLDGVARAQVYGGITREVRVELNDYMLDAYGLTTSDVTGKIRQANANASGGRLEYEDKAYTIKGIGRYSGVEEVRTTVVGYKSNEQASGDTLSTGGRQQGGIYAPDKVPIYLSDVATVAYAPEERTDIVRLDGAECIGLYIYKEAQDNTVRVAGQVEEALARIQQELPDIRMTPIYSQADFINTAIGEVESTALIGVALAVLVLFAFLRNFGATVVVSLAIPLSIMATFTLMYFQNLTLNIMTLGGLALGAGMLVDNAIVVIENIFRRRQIGEDAARAAIHGTTEVGVAIVAATLTTVIVFFPIVYVQGIAAELFKDQAWVVAFALLSSLLVAFLLIPALSARLFARDAGAFHRDRLRLPWYEHILNWALDHRGSVMLSAVVLLAAAALLLPGIGSDFIPRSAENQLQVDVDLLPGTPLDRTASVVAGAEARVRQAMGERLDHVFSTVNVRSTQALFREDAQEAEHQASLTVMLNPRAPSPLSPDGAIALLRPHMDVPEATTTFRIRETSLQQTIGLDRAPVAVEVRGMDTDMLYRLSEQVRDALAQLPTLHTVETSRQAGRPEINLRIDRLLAAGFGLDIQQISQRVRERLSGEVVSDFFSEGDDRNIRVAYPGVGLRELSDLPIETSDGVVLRLKDIAELTPGEGPGTIERRNQSRIVTVTAHLTEGQSLDQAIDDVIRTVARIPAPSGYQFNVTGAEEARRTSFEQLQFALLLSIVLVYMVMASLFESVIHPFAILLTLPLAGVGVVFAFYLAGEPFSVMAYIGIVMLGGIAVNGSIVLVDYINRLRASGLQRREAILLAARERLRPILMTSATTILALLPLTIGLGEGARLRAPMAIAVIGGLVTSTLLTLVVIPVVYDTLDRIKGLNH